MFVTPLREEHEQGGGGGGEKFQGITFSYRKQRYCPGRQEQVLIQLKNFHSSSERCGMKVKSSVLPTRIMSSCESICLLSLYRRTANTHNSISPRISIATWIRIIFLNYTIRNDATIPSSWMRN
jgi:hypothetical protein